MAKNFRGKSIRVMPDHGRGECPVCKRGGVKLLYEVKVNNATIKVCKVCRNIAASRLSA
ncbi:MAG: hypothetical protein PHI68_00545 [Candidatus Cloacimonetes bacterium]|jgi:ribosome-binding protein aMBF1 (putative translation factor)|nr:hypothetical protein [Candidatus Cloacimonadota bacterium]